MACARFIASAASAMATTVEPPQEALLRGALISGFGIVASGLILLLGWLGGNN